MLACPYCKLILHTPPIFFMLDEGHIWKSVLANFEGAAGNIQQVVGSKERGLFYGCVGRICAGRSLPLVRHTRPTRYATGTRRFSCKGGAYRVSPRRTQECAVGIRHTHSTLSISICGPGRFLGTLPSHASIALSMRVLYLKAAAHFSGIVGAPSLPWLPPTAGVCSGYLGLFAGSQDALVRARAIGS